MKRMLIAMLAVILLLSACGNQDNGNAAEYTGQWKANTISGLIDGEKLYTVSVIELQEDGTGTYKGRALSWSYSEEQNTIQVTLLNENQTAAFQIQTVDGITVLKFYDDIYYRAEDFVSVNP